MFSAEEAKMIEEESKKLDRGWSVRVNRGMVCISFYITITNLEEIDKMAKNGRFINRSEGIRVAIKEYIEKYKDRKGVGLNNSK